MKKLFKKCFDKTFFKFILVGIVNTLVGTLVMFLMYNALGFTYWISSASNYIVGSIVSYFLNKHFTFKNMQTGFKPIIKFIINISLCYILAYGLAKPFVKILLSSQLTKVQENISMIVGMGLFVVLNYMGQRFFAFKDGKSYNTDSKL